MILKPDLLRKKLSTLLLLNEDAHREHANWNECDSIDQLSYHKKAGWKKILSSVATTEEVEQTVMQSLEKAFSNDPEMTAYLASHKLDESRHHMLLKRYLLNSFEFTKTHRTFSDSVIYDFIFPKLAHLFNYKPVFAIALLLFFETYGIVFYKKFKQTADQDGLIHLSKLLDQIEKDEQRHLAGIKVLLSLDEFRSQMGAIDLFLLRLLLSIVVIDVNMSIFAIHNRKVRKAVSRIGLCPSQLTSAAYESAQSVYRRMSQKEVLC